MSFDLQSYVPDSFEQTHLAGELTFLRCYRLKENGAPMALLRGCDSTGKLIGGIIYLRAEDDSCNLEMEAPLEQLRSMLEFVSTFAVRTKSNDSMEGLWKRFLDNLSIRLAEKTMRTANGTPIKLEPAVETQECMICLDKPADTTVVPCMHSVVCADCSRQLKNTADAKICCQCRRPIQGVYYPDNKADRI